MPQKRKPLTLRNLRPIVLAGALALATTFAHAQATTTVRGGSQISVFAGGTVVETGINSGRNASITAGVDYGVFHLPFIEPAIELRGTFAADKGHVDSQNNGLIGVRVASHFLSFHPYADLLYGRAEITYTPPLPSPTANVFYTDSASNVLSLGGGVDYHLVLGLSAKLDVQYERLTTPVTPTPHVYATAATIGVVYKISFHHGHGL